MQELFTYLVLSVYILYVKCCYDCDRELSDNLNKQEIKSSLSEKNEKSYGAGEQNSYIFKENEENEVSNTITADQNNVGGFLVSPTSKKFEILKNISFENKEVSDQNSSNAFRVTVATNANIDINIDISSTTLSVSLIIKNKSEEFRGIMEKTSQFFPSMNSPMLSYMLMPALTLAGVVPWVLPGIRMAAGFVQMVNQMAFMAGLAALVRSYVFEARPDEHTVYVNQGYNSHGHMQKRNV